MKVLVFKMLAGCLCAGFVTFCFNLRGTSDLYRDTDPSGTACGSSIIRRRLLIFHVTEVLLRLKRSSKNYTSNLKSLTCFAGFVRGAAVSL